ncbi:MAG: aspartate-semialdehyde dehydrogenase [Ignavibacteriaceae bacterium]|nr:aspartate-semialdehyde dehydrogenase [Ignavibacteriaceae bacterium]
MSKSVEKIPVAILGATGSVGQKFVELLANHPWFEIAELCASDKSAGKKYKDAVDWFLPSPLPERVGEILVQKCEPTLKSKVVFSGLDSNVAGEVETEFAKAGYKVISNSKNHRMDEDVPLLIPEVNPDHLELIKTQDYGDGCIVTNPNCSVIGLVIALKPLLDNFGLESVNVVTMQAISGAGHPRVVKLDIEDNVIPFIGGEEPKVEIEPLKILGELNKNQIRFNDFKISAQCNRVNVTDGHTECVQVNLKKKTSVEEIIQTWRNFESDPQKLKLPLAPMKPIHYSEEDAFPQPKHQRDADKGMAVSIGRLRKDKIFDFSFVILSHNTVRGAAGGAILCAELMKAKGII